LTSIEPVLIDARTLALPLTGVGRYTLELLRRIPVPLIGMAKPGTTIDVDVLSVIRMRGPATVDAVWNEVVYARAMRYFSRTWIPHAQMPWTAPARCRSVVTVHDLSEFEDPTLPWRRRLNLRNAHAAAARGASVLATSTRYVSEQLAVRYGRPADLIVPAAPSIRPTTRSAYQSVGRWLDSRSAADTFWILLVGAPIPRKNYPRLLSSAARYPRVRAVLVGPPGTPDEEARLQPFIGSGRLYRFGYATQTQLAALYELTDALVYVSLSEGFGIPLLDARSVGTRLLVSDIEPLRSNAGDSAILVDPRSESGLQDAIGMLMDQTRPDPEALPGWDSSAQLILEALAV